MKYRMYPQTNISVSEVGFGLWTTSTGWWGEVDDTQAVRLIHEAFDLGITLFDAADTYGNGRSETQLAKAFAPARRGSVIYATKFGYDFYAHADERRGQQEIPHDFSPEYIRFALEQSLRRLDTDCIDIYQIHNARMEQIDDDTLYGLLEDFIQEGKIRAYGVALGPAIGWLYEGIEAVERRNISSVQMIWNMLEPFPGNEMIAAADASDAKTGFMIRVPHSSGMLEGQYTAETTFPANDHRRHRPKSWLLNGVKKIEQLRFLEHSERTLGQAAIQWLLANPRTMTVLPNIYTSEQLREFATAPMTAALSDGELEQIQALLADNFGLPVEPGNFKGTMTREVANR